VSSFFAWKVDAARVGPGVLLWVRNPPTSTKRGATDSHWFLVADVTPPGPPASGAILHLIGISSHPRDMAAAVAMNLAGTPLKSACYACLDWEIDNQLKVVDSNEEGWEYEIRGAQFDRWDATCQQPSYVDLQWFEKTLLPARKKHHESVPTGKGGKNKK
jgi:hypothetical protein